MSIVLVGSTSGSITLQEPAVAGSTVLDLPATSGTLITTGSTGQVIPKAALPTGSVLQVVNAIYSTGASSNSGSFADTGLTATITPTSSSSRILVIVSARHYSAPGSPQSIRLLRGATNIYDITRFGLTDTGAAGSGDYFVANVLDSPATTSATTYKLQFARQSGSGSVYAQLDNNPSSITLMEIAA